MFIPSPHGDDCPDTRRAQTYLKKNDLERLTETVQPGEAADELLRLALEQGAFNSLGNRARKSAGKPLLLLRKPDTKLPWGCAEPSYKQLRAMKALALEIAA